MRKDRSQQRNHTGTALSSGVDENEINEVVDEIEGDGTMIGVDIPASAEANGRMTVVLGKIRPKLPSPGG